MYSHSGDFTDSCWGADFSASVRTPPQLVNDAVVTSLPEPMPLPAQCFCDAVRCTSSVRSSLENLSTYCPENDLSRSDCNIKPRSQSPDDASIYDTEWDICSSRQASPPPKQLQHVEEAEQSCIKYLEAPTIELTDLQERLEATFASQTNDLQVSVPMDNSLMYGEAQMIANRIDSERKYQSSKFIESPKPSSVPSTPEGQTAVTYPYIDRDQIQNSHQMPVHSNVNCPVYNVYANRLPPYSVFASSYPNYSHVNSPHPYKSPNLPVNQRPCATQVVYSYEPHVPLPVRCTNFCPGNKPAFQIPPAPFPEIYSMEHPLQAKMVSFNSQQCHGSFAIENFNRPQDFYLTMNHGIMSTDPNAVVHCSLPMNGFTEPMDPTPTATILPNDNSEQMVESETVVVEDDASRARAKDEKWKSTLIQPRFIDAHCRMDQIFKTFYDLKSQPAPNPSFPITVGQGLKFDMDSLRGSYQSSWFPQYLSCVASFSVSSTNFDEEGNYFEKILLNDEVWGTIGCHPLDVDNYEADTEAIILSKALHPKIVALGEIGLDYSSYQCDKEIQKAIFERQLMLVTREIEKPVVLHCCNAEADCFQILKRVLPHDFPIYWHCFNENASIMTKWHSHFTNLYFGVALDILDESKLPKLEAFYKECPIDRILVESNAPSFLPHQYVGQLSGLECSHPGLGVLAAFRLAEIRSIDEDVLLNQLFDNIQRFYAIPFKFR